MIVGPPNVGAPNNADTPTNGGTSSTGEKKIGKYFNMVENYIYLYHTGTFIVIPTYPDSITDTLNVSFATTTPLSRSAPIYSYQNSGPRSVQFSLRLQREMMTLINYEQSNSASLLGNNGDDYIDVLIRELQAIALPKYNSTAKMVDPPIIAVRFGNDVFCKGVVQGGVSVTYELPILEGDKYSVVNISFTVHEIDPYDASTVMLAGSYRGLDPTLERNIYKG